MSRALVGAGAAIVLAAYMLLGASTADAEQPSPTLTHSAASSTPSPTAPRQSPPPAATTGSPAPSQTAKPLGTPAALTPAPSPRPQRTPTPRPASPTPVSAPEPPHLDPSAYVTLLNVPYRTQFDTSPWAAANCGPASLAMVLAAYGLDVSNADLRSEANAIQGSSGLTDGVALDTIAKMASTRDVQTTGLRGPDGNYSRWEIGKLAEQVADGRPVITLVHYRSLPGNESQPSESDHYIVIVGAFPSGYVFSDPAYLDESGALRLISYSQLERAWADSVAPGQAVAFGPPTGADPLATAHLLASELSSYDGARAAASPTATETPAPTETPMPAPTETPTPLPTATATAIPPTRTPVADRWNHRYGATATPISGQSAGWGQQQSSGPALAKPPALATSNTTPQDVLVLAAGPAEGPDGTTLVLLFAGAVGGGAIVTRGRRTRRSAWSRRTQYRRW